MSLADTLTRCGVNLMIPNIIKAVERLGGPAELPESCLEFGDVQMIFDHGERELRVQLWDFSFTGESADSPEDLTLWLTVPKDPHGIWEIVDLVVNHSSVGAGLLQVYAIRLIDWEVQKALEESQDPFTA